MLSFDRCNPVVCAEPGSTGIYGTVVAVRGYVAYYSDISRSPSGNFVFKYTGMVIYGRCGLFRG